MTLTCTIAEDVEALEPFRASWDSLAVECGRPYSAPGWLLPWCRHVGPAVGQLRALIAAERGELVGIAPLICSRNRLGLARYRPLGAGLCIRVEPLARPGREQEVATAFSRALLEARPRPNVVSFEGIPASSPWPRLLIESWPSRRPRLLRSEWGQTSLTIELQGRDYSAWFASKSGHFRRRVRQQQRLFEEAGGSYRRSSDEEVERDLLTLTRLHYERWEGRGGSQVLTPDVQKMLVDAAYSLAQSGRFRLWMLEINGAPIAANLLITAGSEFADWMTGFDVAYQHFSPSRLCMMAAIEDAAGQKATRLEMGGGRADYKVRYADAIEPLEWLWLVPPSWAMPILHSHLLARRVRREVARRIPDRAKKQLRQRTRRL